MPDNKARNGINNFFSRFRSYLDFLKIDKKLLVVCILSLLLPIALNGVYFLFSFNKVIRDNEHLQAQNNVDRIKSQLDEIMNKAADIANRIYTNPIIHQTVAVRYENTLDVYNAYRNIYMFDDYMYSYREIAGIRLYIENDTMLDNSYFIYADEYIREQGWYNDARKLEGRMFWVYRYDPISRAEYISLVRQIRHITTGSYVGVLCINLDIANFERICAAEFHDIVISLNDAVICPAGSTMESFPENGNWIITNTFTPHQTVNNVFEIAYIIPRQTLLAPVYTMMRRGSFVIFASLIISLILIMQIVNEVYVQKLQREQLFSRQKEMQLKILSNQINPHFLYNTLETIRMMALEKKEKEIAATIKKLSQILRQTLSSHDKTVSAAVEIELVRNYLAIRKLRFGNRMEYTIDMDEKAGACTIPPLLIQPLVENSLIHGLETKTGGGYINISVKTYDKTLYIDVTDNGTGINPKRLEKLQEELNSGEDTMDGRIGLVNVNRRIKLYYGNNYGLVISENSTEGVNVRIVIPDHPRDNI